MKEKDGEHPLGDAGQLILLAVFIVVWIVDSFFLRISGFLPGLVPVAVRLILLVAAEALAVLLVRWGHVVVGGEERPQRVVSSGAFRYVRHPLYLGSILFYAGLTVSTLSLLSIAALAVIVIFYDSIASYEEKLMEVKFGAEYAVYRETTGKWVPRMGGKNG
jgi:protein-S-isoprenylcysteine O-methyltransferase Ste14